MTLVVNLFAGPGAGKSTTAALVFGKLKQAGISVEIAHEYAKDLTWEDRHKAIKFQPYVTTKQMWRVHRLLDQVDVVITDSPILLSIVYGGQGYNEEFAEFVVKIFKSWDTMNYFLRRGDYKYQEQGRHQTKQEATALDGVISNLLGCYEIPFKVIAGGGIGTDYVVKEVLERL